MRKLFLLLLMTALGCQTCPVSQETEAPVAAGPCVRAQPDIVACAATAATPSAPYDLPTLWNLALANNPALAEAAAEFEAARGRQIQAGKYPNPRFVYEQEELGTSQAPAGAMRIQLNQEIITAGKRHLDVAIAAREGDVAAIALLGKRFEVLTRVRRAYYDYLGWKETARVNAKNVAALEEGLASTEKLVIGGQAPPVDLLRLRALLEEARIDEARSRVSAEASWRRLAAEVGIPPLPLTAANEDFPKTIPQWDWQNVEQRVLTIHTELRQAGLGVQRARLEVERARADVVPNVQVGGGYSWSFFERAQGAVVSVETPLPLWDRKQGHIQEAQAHWARAQAVERHTAARLTQDSAEAFARYEGARRQVDRLASRVLPPLEESLKDVLERYQRGAPQAFIDVLVAEQSLNEARRKLAEARRDLWLAIADLQGLMQLDVDEERATVSHPCR